MAIRKGARRKSITLDDDTIKEIELLVKKRDMNNISEWINWAIDNGISEEHGQYGIAGLTAQRINQLQDSIVEMSKSIDNLSDLIIGLSRMMNNLLAGSSYLNDADDDDIDVR